MVNFENSFEEKDNTPSAEEIKDAAKYLGIESTADKKMYWDTFTALLDFNRGKGGDIGYNMPDSFFKVITYMGFPAAEDVYNQWLKEESGRS